MANVEQREFAGPEEIRAAKLLVVGAGGIGCELLKNLVLTGFRYIEVIDLDTIDVSNLNRQFLFRKQHVGKSKAVVARESVQALNPDAKIIAHHSSIFEKTYGRDFFKKFNVVLNALDNRAARNHVNRMCLNVDVPLVESGTAGYLGQVTVIKKGITECYECQPKATQKTYPGCTIRNTPSEPIHCIVWAKHLFNQLFGEEDPDQDVSPDTADPEAAGDAGQEALASDGVTGGVERSSTREWAKSCDWDPVKLFNKLFRDDIKYLLSMANLWQHRRPPTPLDWGNLPDSVPGSSTSAQDSDLLEDQRMWSAKMCGQMFGRSVNTLKERLKTKVAEDKEHGYLIWDKDDDPSLDFVTAAAGIRSHIFGIAQKTRFDVRSMAGNIIPAIATTNAVIAGLIVMELLKVLCGNYSKCKTVYLVRQPKSKKKLLVPCELVKPNPACPVCSEKHEVTVRLNCETTTVKTLEEKVLKDALTMVAPDVEIEDGKGTILISSEEGETEGNHGKFLKDFGIGHDSRLKCDDFFQDFEVVVNIMQSEDLERGVEFELIGNVAQLKAKMDAKAASGSTPRNGQPNGTAETTSANSDVIVDDEEDIEIEEEEVEEDEMEKDEEEGAGDKMLRKRKAENLEKDLGSKRPRVEPDQSDDDLIVL
ncbi:PREDICTED: SUMO-activating enzyme subunit 2-like [Priapulus caudatus]|uniref:SUMO-activating enzyme subunit n=1 Tax=Priapulus caudatus TaxID=37621 RepID=A0ABM1DXX2_PRICU|nr:PREDICTED: SUMO-activating enzyme subunit 2-like [Priapulus caudatus]